MVNIKHTRREAHSAPRYSLKTGEERPTLRLVTTLKQGEERPTLHLVTRLEQGYNTPSMPPGYGGEGYNTPCMPPGYGRRAVYTPCMPPGYGRRAVHTQHASQGGYLGVYLRGVHREVYLGVYLQGYTLVYIQVDTSLCTPWVYHPPTICTPVHSWVYHHALHTAGHCTTLPGSRQRCRQRSPGLKLGDIPG